MRSLPNAAMFRLPDQKAFDELQRKLRPDKAVAQVAAPVVKKYRNEALLRDACQAAGLPVPQIEYRFHIGRKWRFDCAWPDRMLACEVDGMVHRIKARFLADIEKRNEATLAGWRLIHVTPGQVRDGMAVKLLAWALEVFTVLPAEQRHTAIPQARRRKRRE